MTADLNLGSLAGQVRAYPEGMGLLLSSGPVSDAFIMSRGARDLLNGPVGSGKTTACVKRALRSAIEQPPLTRTVHQVGSGRPAPTSVRRYSLAVWRETYAQLWGTTIKSWRKVLNPDNGIGKFTGAFPRAAEHVIEFNDGWGSIQIIAKFQAFGDAADPDDLGGTEYTDAYLNEMDKLPEALAINLARSVGRDPTRGEIGLPDDPSFKYGRIFGDCNAPSPLEWVYRDYFDPTTRPAGYKLFRQPGGRHPDAENLKAVGKQYYIQQVEANAHRPWWIRVKIDNEPGFNRDTDVVYPKFSDSRMVSAGTLSVFRELPVIISCDGGNTPAAVFSQQLANGQWRILAEVALDRGDELDLARHVNVIIASPRFEGCTFVGTADPACFAGDDTTNGSWASRFSKATGVKLKRPPISNEDTEGRHLPLREAMERTLSGDQPGFLLDPSCVVIRRGLNGTFHYHRIRGTNTRGSIVKTPDSHAVEAAEYGASLSGTAAARRRVDDKRTERERKRAEAARGGRYNPLRRRS